MLTPRPGTACAVRRTIISGGAACLMLSPAACSLTDAASTSPDVQPDRWLQVTFQRVEPSRPDKRAPGPRPARRTDVTMILHVSTDERVRAFSSTTRDEAGALVQGTLLRNQELLLRLYDNCHDDSSPLPTKPTLHEMLRDTAGPVDPAAAGFRRVSGDEWEYTEPGFTYRLTKDDYRIFRGSRLVTTIKSRRITEVRPGELKLPPCTP